jgi:hypothetical protein
MFLFLVSECTFTTLEPVPFDLCDNINDPPSSPPPLVIDTTEHIICSQFNIPNCSVQNQSKENSNLIRTPLANNRTNSNSENAAYYSSIKSHSINITQKELSTNNNTTTASVNMRLKNNSGLNFEICGFFRTPAVERNISHSVSQISSRSIVVPQDRSSRNSNEDNIYNNRTSTPRPPRHDQVNHDNLGVHNDSFSIDSIPPDTKVILSRFSDFRRLVKAYRNEQQKCKIWINDYARLKRNYDRLEQNSFRKLFDLFV